MRRLAVACARATTASLAAAVVAVMAMAMPSAAAASGPSPSSSPTPTADSSPPPSQPSQPPVTTCAALGQGATGAAVKTIQALVGTTADGDFGPQTQAALQSWQTQAGIPDTGVVDAATWATMPVATADAACGQQLGGSGFTASCAVLSQGDTGTAVGVLQGALGQPVDGVFGSATGQALDAAQQKAGMQATATTDGPTWQLLGMAGTPVCTPGSSTPALPKDYKAQQRVRRRVARMAARLLDQPGTTTDKVALAAIAFAKKQVGKPYRYGAAGPKAYDCSGLQMASYLHAGLTLPRVAADQYAGSGPMLPLDQAQAGDLLFFAGDVTKPATIYHVAMYLGGGEVLDAPHTGADVEVTQLWTTDLLPHVVRPVAALTLPLRPGATGWTVAQLQQALNRHGANLTVDGGYGPATQAAVQAWQQQHGLAADGVVRLRTWLTLG